MNLWQMYETWQKECEWVDMSHELSPETPHWIGWDALTVEEKMNLDESIFAAHAYTTVGQYGTHVDAPNHMVKGMRSLDQIAVAEMVMPMCVVDVEDKCCANPDYVMTVDDILAWEELHGKIPEGAFVVMKSGWCKREAATMDNNDAEGKRHFPGWGLECVKFLVEERSIGTIGHETSDTEAPITSSDTSYEVERYILAQDRIQFEMLTNVHKCPPTGAIVFGTFPKVKDGTGYPARVFALCPKG